MFNGNANEYSYVLSLTCVFEGDCDSTVDQERLSEGRGTIRALQSKRSLLSSLMQKPLCANGQAALRKKRKKKEKRSRERLTSAVHTDNT